MAPSRPAQDNQAVSVNGNSNGITSAQNGPPPSTIQVAKPYLFQQQLQSILVVTGSNAQREDHYRLAGVQYINDVRNTLQLPVRTFTTACIYYHKFRLAHKDTEYQYAEAATAALSTACKIEDTLKKSKEILCAAHNLKAPAAEHLSPDDPTFEGPSKVVIGIERLMLETSSFDFRSRDPPKHLVKIAKHIGIEKVGFSVAYNILLDAYRTFAPLKQSSTALCFACLELATLITGDQLSPFRGDKAAEFAKFSVTRDQIMETMLDLLDLYTHFQKSTIIGPHHDINTFIQIRITLNQEDPVMSRYTETHEAPKANGMKSSIMTPKTPITPASPSDTRTHGREIQSPATLSPRSAGSGKRGKGQDGTIRFMIDAEEAKREKIMVADYFKDEYEEYVVEVDEPIKPERDDRVPRGGAGGGGGGGGGHRHNGRDRSFPYDKRIRR